MTTIEAIAPTRICLAGESVDIFPVYIFESYGLVISATINRLAKVKLTPRNDGKVSIYSKDFNEKLEGFPREFKLDNNLDLLKMVIKSFNSEEGFDIVTTTDTPPGSGLGTSSSLVVALAGALNQFQKHRADNIPSLPLLQAGLLCRAREATYFSKNHEFTGSKSADGIVAFGLNF